MESSIIIQSKPKQRIYLSELQQNIGSSCRAAEEARKILQKLLDGSFSATETGEFYEGKALVEAVGNFKFSIFSDQTAH